MQPNICLWLRNSGGQDTPDTKSPAFKGLGISWLIIFALPGSFRLLLTSDAWLLVMLALANLLLDSSFRTTSLETAQSAVQCFVFFYDYV